MPPWSLLFTPMILKYAAALVKTWTATVLLEEKEPTESVTLFSELVQNMFLTKEAKIWYYVIDVILMYFLEINRLVNQSQYSSELLSPGSDFISHRRSAASNATVAAPIGEASASTTVAEALASILSTLANWKDV